MLKEGEASAPAGIYRDVPHPCRKFLGHLGSPCGLWWLVQEVHPASLSSQSQSIFRPVGLSRLSLPSSPSPKDAYLIWGEKICSCITLFSIFMVSTLHPELFRHVAEIAICNVVFILPFYFPNTVLILFRSVLCPTKDYIF